jgi:soluble lytic murein transglycosylase-like protein
MKRLLPILLLSIFLSNLSFAETATLNQDYVARTTDDFTTRQNIKAVIPSGTAVEIVDRKLLPSGNYGLKVRITSLGGSVATKLKDGDTVWVYYHMQKQQRVWDLYDKSGKLVDSPKTAVAGKSTKSFSINQSTPADTTANPPYCAACAAKAKASATSQPAADAVKQPIADIQKVAAENVDEMVPSVEELSSYLQQVGPSPTKRQIATDEKIAQNIIKDCGNDDPNILIPLVLAMMKQESGFHAGVHNSNRGAEGLMQILPSTARQLHCGKDLHDIETNISCGVKFVKQLLAQHPGDITAVLEAYNAGPGREDAIEKGIKRIPRETKAYVKNITATIGEYYSIMKTTALSLVANN